jgi:hypothetical protein
VRKRTRSIEIEPHYRIAEAARLLRVARPTMYNLLRGLPVVDFAPPGKKGVKLVPASTLRRLLEKNTKRFR